MNEDPSGVPQRGLHVFRFVVDDDEEAKVPHLLKETTRRAKRAPRRLPVDEASLRAWGAGLRSGSYKLASTVRRALPAAGVGASLALVVLGIVMATQYMNSHRPVALGVARPVRASYSLSEVPRAQRIHIQAAALIRTAIDRTSTVAPPFNGYLYDMPRSHAFARSWQTVISALPVDVRSANRWLVSLEMTAAPNEAIETLSGKRYILASGCDPSDCEARSVQVAYNIASSAVAASVALNGSLLMLGSTSIDDRATLLAEIARERLGLHERFPLQALDAAKAERFIAATSLE